MNDHLSGVFFGLFVALIFDAVVALGLYLAAGGHL